jgi:outer membrane protein assembly factor BamB
MTQDFVTTLRGQLREAAEREARRGPLRRALPQPRALALAGALAFALAVLVIAGGTLAGHDSPPATQPAPHVVARLQLADQGGSIASGFGALWLADPGAGRVLRAGADGGVIASIPIRGDLFDVSAGAGAVWALTDERLFRIDPASNRVTASIVLPLPTRSSGAVISRSGVVWVGNPAELLHIDTATNRIDRRVSLERGRLEARGFAAQAGLFFVRDVDGLLETLDARTGRRLGLAHPAVDGNLLAASGGTVLVTSGAGVAALDASTGRLRWRSNLGVSRVNGALYGDGALWVQGTPPSGRDQLWRLDPRSGRVTAAVPLSDFGASGMATLGGRLWIMSPAGTVTVIR